jgi:RNA polymerase sigma factor (TIGR02999 family)
MEKKKEITRLLMDFRNGDEEAYKILFTEVYNQLRNLAVYQLENHHTISKTELVHEVYIKLANYTEIEWENRAHFYAIASRCMRQILVDYSRKKASQKRGGDQQQITLNEEKLNLQEHAFYLLELNELIDKLATFDERKSKVVEMRFFAGMNMKEISEVLNVSKRTVDRDWLKARAWLLNELR